MKKNQDDYEIVPFPKMRRFALDAGRMGRRKHIVHALVELDVTQWSLLLPAFVRRLFYWVVTKIPHLVREYSSSVLVTAVGMFGKGAG